jgi:hypothetical protein
MNNMNHGDMGNMNHGGMAQMKHGNKGLISIMRTGSTVKPLI